MFLSIKWNRLPAYLVRGRKAPCKGKFSLFPEARCLPLSTSCFLATSEGGGGHPGEGLLSALPVLSSPAWHQLHLPTSVVLSRLLCQPQPQSHLRGERSQDLPRGWFRWARHGGVVASFQPSLLRTVVASLSGGALKFAQLFSMSLVAL